ncbi:folate-sensitive fragile site protein Fra10Ac1-domain-containing protein [Multifurca ochricompacta]|uniref:Folate-sensitive fragile site protein Fra10Ac1-domain-containing protein n=1 Tax=Multifurca ochricompacta TaxID=376703 RepID=A0AAD4M7Q2_9AGAM|nr:folate-sensitive fragile site protein Fra10Ac1-domain-containing protein [Multifurca ochricompacta]
MSLYSKAKVSSTTEFDILRASHKFCARNASWNDQLAQKYYDSLFREFAVCDLKHYKSGNFALRWRTEAEVLSGAGENTCGNTRCKHHDNQDETVQLNTLELPFAYEENEERKSALVKVVLCSRCSKKLMWKRNKERENQAATSVDGPIERSDHEGIAGEIDDKKRLRRSQAKDSEVDKSKGAAGVSARRRSSRSRSPSRTNKRSSQRRRSRSPYT